MTITITNPVIWADVPDPDVIRVGQVYYMVSTSMHSMPGCPIMKSVNLRDWELVSYLYDTFEDNEGHQLLDIGLGYSIMQPSRLTDMPNLIFSIIPEQSANLD